MRRQWPVLAPAFLISVGLGFGGARTYRQGQDPATDTVASASSTTTPETTTAPDTSLLQIPETTVVADTLAPDTTLPPETTVTEFVPDAVPALGPDGAVMRPLSDGLTGRQQLDPANECASLSPTGSADDCGTFTAEGQSLRWVSYESDGGTVIDILAPEDADAVVWDVKLRSEIYSERPTVRTGTGLAPFVFSARRDDSARTLDVDVIEGADPGVSLHLALNAGRVRVTASAIEAWNGVPHDGDPAGEPSQFDHWTIERSGGGWVISSSEAVPSSEVP